MQITERLFMCYLTLSSYRKEGKEKTKEKKQTLMLETGLTLANRHQRHLKLLRFSQLLMFHSLKT